MSTFREPLAKTVKFDAERITVELSDGRAIAVPIDWFPSLRDATDEERTRWELIGDGQGIHWSDLDEDLSVLGFMAADAGPLEKRQAPFIPSDNVTENEHKELSLPETYNAKAS